MPIASAGIIKTQNSFSERISEGLISSAIHRFANVSDFVYKESDMWYSHSVARCLQPLKKRKDRKAIC